MSSSSITGGGSAQVSRGGGGGDQLKYHRGDQLQGMFYTMVYRKQSFLCIPLLATFNDFAMLYKFYVLDCTAPAQECVKLHQIA